MKAAATTSNATKISVRGNRSSSNHVSPLLNGKAVPWHGLGLTLLEKHLSLQDALKFTKMDRKVGMRDCFMMSGGKSILVPDTRVCYWVDNDEPFKVVGDRYKQVQNVDAFSFIEPFINSKKLSIETCGSLKDGVIVWMLADTAVKPVTIIPANKQTGAPADEVRYYVHVTHSHDGTISIRASFMPVRMVNMTFLSQGHVASENIIKVKHTASTNIDADTMAMIMDNAERDFAAITDLYKKFATVTLTKQQALNYFKKVIVVKGESKDVEKTLDNLMFIYENKDGCKLAGNTLWSAYNAVCEFDSWYRGRTTDTRLQSLWFGAYGETNRKALEVATAMAK